jgi:centrosomal protein CEP135
MDQQQRQYFELRKKLVQLNYPSNFGVDSMDLVQRLFTDLISTTESYTQLQEKENRLSQDLSLTQAQIFPLRKENAKLMKDNHQLHADTVKLNEELAASELNFTTKIRSIEEQLKNAEYIISCKDDEISRAEKKWIKLREVWYIHMHVSLFSF